MVIPKLVQSVFFVLIQFEHSGHEDARQDTPHNFDTILKEGLLDDLVVHKFVDEPLCAPHILVDVGLEISDHIWQVLLVD